MFVVDFGLKSTFIFFFGNGALAMESKVFTESVAVLMNRKYCIELSSVYVKKQPALVEEYCPAKLPFHDA